MYGASSKEWGCAMAIVAIVGGLVCVGIEHAVVWVWHHLVVGWK